MRSGQATFRVALTLAVVWGVWWTVLGLVSGLGEGLDALGVVMHTVVPGGICLVLALFAIFRSRSGAWLLLGAGAVLAIGYPFLARPQFGWDVVAVMELTLAAPPIIAGVLMRRHRDASRA